MAELSNNGELAKMDSTSKKFLHSPPLPVEPPVPSVVLMVSVLSSVADWFHLGFFLEVPVEELHKIEADHQKMGRRCKTEMLCWYERNRRPTWSAIVTALKKIGRRTLAQTIVDQYGLPQSLVSQPAPFLSHIPSPAGPGVKLPASTQQQTLLAAIEAENDVLKENVSELEARLVEKEARIVELEARIVELYAKEGRMSQCWEGCRGRIEQLEMMMTHLQSTHLFPSILMVTGPPFLPDPQKCRADGCGLRYRQTSEEAEFKVHLADMYGAPCVKRQVVTARLTSLVNRSSAIEANVKSESPASYAVSYQTNDRGRHELSVEVNGQPIAGSPFHVCIYQPPSLMGNPVRVIRGVDGPYRPVKSQRSHQLFLSTKAGVSVLDREDSLVRSSSSEVELHPCGIAVDGNDCLYASNYATNEVFKLSPSGKLLVLMGGEGSGPGELSWPGGVAIRGEELFVCDRENHRVQVFDLNLNFLRQFGCHGSGKGQFDQPTDLAFDLAGNVYILDVNNRVQVFSLSGSFQRMFGRTGTGRGELKCPKGIHVDCDYVYITEWKNHRVSIFTILGEFVTSFGMGSPWGITMDGDGFLYVCDTWNNCVCVF